MIEFWEECVNDRHGAERAGEDARYAITMDGAVAATGLVLRDGTPVVLRPVRPDDEPRMAAFHAGLSARSVYQRYFHITSLEQRITHQRLALTCRVDPAEGFAIVAEHDTAAGPEILALGRVRRTGTDEGEIALLVVDRSQGLGLGTALIRAIVAQARRQGLRRLYGDMLADNDAMRAVVRGAGFDVRPVPGDAMTLRADLRLPADASKAR